MRLTAQQIDELHGLHEIIYRNDSLTIVATLGPRKVDVQCLLDSRVDINVIRHSKAYAAGIPISSLPPTLLYRGMTVANGQAVYF